jgi:hypothetical protein
MEIADRPVRRWVVLTVGVVLPIGKGGRYMRISWSHLVLEVQNFTHWEANENSESVVDIVGNLHYG